MGALGADVEALGRLATSMRGASRQLSEVAVGLERRARLSGWTGADAARFEHDWRHRHRPALLALADRCDRLARTLDREAAQQWRASSPSSSLALDGPPPAPAVARPARSTLPAAPLVEHRFSGGVDVKVAFATATLTGDVWLQALADGRTRVTVIEAGSLGVAAGVGATAEVSISGTAPSTTPVGGAQAEARARAGGVLRRSWVVERDEVGELLARVAVAEATERTGVLAQDPTREVELGGRGSRWVARSVGGLGDGLVERLTGIDPGLDDAAAALVTLPAPDRVESLAEVEVVVGGGAGMLGQLGLGGHAGATGTIRAGKGLGDGTRSTIVEVQGGVAGSVSAAALQRLGVALPPSLRELGMLHLELVERDGAVDHLLVTATHTGDSSIDQLRARVEIDPSRSSDGSTLRGFVSRLASGDVRGAALGLTGLDGVTPSSIVVTGDSAELSGTTVRAGGSVSAGIGAAVTARGQVLHVDRRGS